MSFLYPGGGMPFPLPHHLFVCPCLGRLGGGVGVGLGHPTDDMRTSLRAPDGQSGA